jgi:Flp pilus assembly protein TadB
MPVGVSDEWGQFQRWLSARLEVLRGAEPEIDPSLMERISELFSAIFQDGGAAAAVTDIESMVARGPHAASAAVLRKYLAYALAARTVEARCVTRDGALMVLERNQRAACVRYANQILALETGDGEAERFATELLDRVRAGDRWEWSRELGAAPAVLAVLVCGLLVVAGALLHLIGVVVFGVLAGTAAVYLFVLLRRKQHWQVEAQVIRPLVWRFGR